jgi:hypothetical protein
LLPSRGSGELTGQYTKAKVFEKVLPFILLGEPRFTFPSADPHRYGQVRITILALTLTALSPDEHVFS